MDASVRVGEKWILREGRDSWDEIKVKLLLTSFKFSKGGYRLKNFIFLRHKYLNSKSFSESLNTQEGLVKNTLGQ